MFNFAKAVAMALIIAVVTRTLNKYVRDRWRQLGSTSPQ
jgi:hypothetical protein